MRDAVEVEWHGVGEQEGKKREGSTGDVGCCGEFSDKNKRGRRGEQKQLHDHIRDAVTGAREQEGKEREVQRRDKRMTFKGML